MLTTVHFNAVNCTEMYTYNTSTNNYYHSVFNAGTTPGGGTAITTLSIGNGVNRIPNHAFRNSTGILDVLLPQWLTNIGDYAFANCGNLVAITSMKVQPPVAGGNAFYNVPVSTPVFVPCNASEAYAAATGWSQFSNIVELCTNQIIAIAFPPNGGTVNGSGTYPDGYTCSLSALANPGYYFVHWRKNGEVVSTNTTFNFVVNGSGGYVAVFSQTQSYEITATANPAVGGAVTGAGTYQSGTTCNLTATPATGYGFTNWTENGNVVSTNANYSFTVTGNRTLVANFTSSPANYTISVSANPSNGGTVTGGGTYQQGQNCTVTATAASGYTFNNWTENGSAVSTNASYSFTVNGNRTLVANFEATSGGYHWTPNSGQYANTMAVIGVIQIDGVEQATNTLELGAFCGDECRGRERLTYYSQMNRYLLFLNIFGNDGNQLSFRLYDHSLNQELDLACANTLTFATNGTVGSATDPYVFNFTSTQTQTTTLTEGWSWWSSYIELDGIDGLAQMETSLGSSGVMIKSRNDGFVTNYGSVWVGSLLSVNNENTYLIQTNAACTMEVTGNMAVAASHPITLPSGWSWIGYPCGTPMSVGTALSGLTPSSNDQIKSREGFAVYYPGAGWLGTLSTLTPGMGLMFESHNSATVTLTYPDAAKSDGLKENITARDNHWQPAMQGYPDNMSVVAVVELDGAELQGEHYEIAAFANGECRGSARLMRIDALNRCMAFLTVYGEGAAELRFGLYDAVTGDEVFSSDDHLTFAANATSGNPKEPFALSFRSLTGTDEWGSSLHVYPNPVQCGQSLSLGLAGETGRVEVEIINALGVVETRLIAPAQTPMMIKAPNVAGVYTLRVFVEGKGTCYRKLVVR